MLHFKIQMIDMLFDIYQKIIYIRKIIFLSMKYLIVDQIEIIFLDRNDH